jgi:hypothetical protein
MGANAGLRGSSDSPNRSSACVELSSAPAGHRIACVTPSQRWWREREV